MDCPNCLTPWKCNGPHLYKKSDIHYSFDYGYFLLENRQWHFLPSEKKLNKEQLNDIIDILNWFYKQNESVD